MENLTSAQLVNLLETLTAKGVSFEYIGDHSRVTFYQGTVLDYGTTWGGQLGINVEKSIWAWWSVWTNSDTLEVESVYFKQRYNAACGKVLKSWKTGKAMAEKVLKLTGVNLE